MKVLVIRSARPEVYEEYRRRHRGNDITLLTPGSNRSFTADRILAAAAGPLRWGWFAPQLQRQLSDENWDEIVILHNGGGGYLPLYQLTRRIAPRTRLRIFFRDGHELVLVGPNAAIARWRLKAALRTACFLPTEALFWMLFLLQATGRILKPASAR